MSTLPPELGVDIVMNSTVAAGGRPCEGDWMEVLATGSLNLSVQNEMIEELMSPKATCEEAGSAVVSAGVEHIPHLRHAYLDCVADAGASGKRQEVSARAARNPLAGRVELFAPIGLWSYFGLVESDRVTGGRTRRDRSAKDFDSGERESEV